MKMRKPSKRSRKEEEEEEIESGSEFDSDGMDNDMFPDARDESDNGDDDDVDDHGFDSDGGEEIGDDESEEDGKEREEEDDDEEEEHGEREEKLTEEMKQLEKEYMELQNQQDLLRTLKHHKDEDFLKGQAVKNQKALWDKTLEFRFMLQKAFANSNRLPQEPIMSSFCEFDVGVSDAYSDLIKSSKSTLDSILELQEALLDKNPVIAQSADVNSGKFSKHINASGNLNEEVDEEWSKISQMQSRMASFRDKSIDKWHRKTQVATGAAAIKSKLQAFNQSISEQIAAYMRDPTKMIKGMQQNRSAVGTFGTVRDSTDNINEEVFNAEGDPELLDDSEFYQQLLQEFFETIDPTLSVDAVRRLRPRKRKIVDRRASKSRKIRYHVHEKIVKFMAPEPMNLPDMAPKLFQNLFGLRNQKPVSVEH